MNITRGDKITVSLTLRLGSEEGTEVNLAGATFESKFPADGGGSVTIPNEQHEIADQDDYPGKVSILLEAEDTEQFRVGQTQDIKIKVTQGEASKTYTCRGFLNVEGDEHEEPETNVFVGAPLC